MGSQNSEESEDHEKTHIDLKEQRRLKRLDQLALARQKAAEVKKRRSAPKKELKNLEQQVKERLYQEDLKRVERLREQATFRESNDTTSRGPMPNQCLSRQPKMPPSTERLSEDPHLKHLDNLINILYG